MGGLVGIAALLLLPACATAADRECHVLSEAGSYAGKRDGADVDRPRAGAELLPVLGGCGTVVDVQFVPGSDRHAVVLDQKGTAWWADLEAKTTGRWLELDVSSGWEQGLLGLAFHPQFAQNGRVFVNHTVDAGGRLLSRVTAFDAAPDAPFGAAPVRRHDVYEVEQPYGNHNGGGLAFGPDGMLYIGLGDGGKAADPHGHGQNAATALGAMLRIDVDTVPYAVPPDNPSVGREGHLPEVWATGLRNPWRYSFDPAGRLVAGDVGQNAWEEVTFVTAGSNLGWNAREGAHCFEPAKGCRTEGLLEPLWDYGRSEGQCITGGYVASEPASLAGRYVVGDFASGRIWALVLPETGKRATDVASVGRFPVKIAGFGRDGRGRIYVAGWEDGRIYRLIAE